MSRSCRREVFEADTVGVYHCYSRTVRRCFLCGHDSYSGKNYSHRRGWIRNRLRFLAQQFGIDIFAYAVMSNHFHIVLRNRPDLVESWEDREVARRWLLLCPLRKNAYGQPEQPTEEELTMLVRQPETIAEYRARLSNPSWLMRLLCQEIGRRSNREENCTGKFFDGRFKMVRLLDEAAVLACMAYVDLNPIRAGATDSLGGYAEVSIGERMRTLEETGIDPSDWLAPIAWNASPCGAEETRGSEPTRAPEATDSQQVSPPNGSEPTADAASSQDGQTPPDASPPNRRGCLPIGMKDYLRLLVWLAATRSSGANGASESGPPTSGEAPGDEAGTAILARLGLEAQAFREVVENFGRCFSTAAGSPSSLRREASRRGRRCLHAPGRRALVNQTEQ